MPSSQAISLLKQAAQKTRLTDSYVSALQPRSKVYVVKDTEVKQLRVVVQPTASKAFYVQYGQKKRKLGDVKVISVQQARHEAVKLLSVGLEKHRLTGKTLNQAFDEYLSSREFSKGFESNLNQCKRIFSRLLERSIEAISKEDVARCIVSARKVGGELLADSTKDSALNVLSSVFTYQIALDSLEDNPVKNVKARIPKLDVNKRTNRLGNKSDIESFINWYFYGVVAGSGVSYKNVQDFKLIRLAALFMLLTGARVGEVVKLKKEDVWLNSEGETNTSNRMKPRTITFRNTKNGRDHTLQLTHHCNLVVMQSMGMTSDTNPYVFRNEARGNPVSENAMYMRIENAVKKIIANSVPLNPHDLRRTFAYHGALAGLSEKQVGIILNHSNGTMTERYQGELSDMTLGILEKYEEHLGKLVSQDVFDDGEPYRLKGLGLLSRSRIQPAQKIPLSELAEQEDMVMMQFDEYYVEPDVFFDNESFLDIDRLHD